MEEYLKSRGIKKENTASYTPQQNGKAERDNRTIDDSARTMIHAKSLLLSLWAEAVNTAVYVLNRTVSLDGRATPYELWVGKKSTISHLRIFGSAAYVLVPKQFTKKLDTRGKKLILVDYEGDSTNYRVYDPTTNSVSITSMRLSMNEWRKLKLRRNNRSTRCWSFLMSKKIKEKKESKLKLG